MALPRWAPPTTVDRVRRGLGELVDVGPRAGTGRLGRDRRDDLGVLDRHDAADRGHHRDRGLAAAGDHVDVGRIDVEVEVDGRADERTDRSRRQVDRLDSRLLETRGIGLVRVCAGRIEHQVGQLVARQQPVDALMGCLDALGPGSGQAVRRGIDPDHVSDVDELAALQLRQQVGADVARADDRCGCLVMILLGVDGALGREAGGDGADAGELGAEGVAGADGERRVCEPGSTMWPGFERDPESAHRVREPYQATTAGDPSTAPPAPVPATSPLRWRTQPLSRRSTSRTPTGVLPSTMPPDEALSAIVSRMPICQSRIRLSMISMAGSTKSTAAMASATVTPGPRSGRFSTNAISGSTRGWR